MRNLFRRKKSLKKCIYAEKNGVNAFFVYAATFCFR